jgi:hypothetical protein
MNPPVSRPNSTADLSTKLFYGFGAVANGAKSNGFNWSKLAVAPADAAAAGR